MAARAAHLGRRRREQPGALGEAARHAPTCTSPWRRSRPTPRAWRPSPRGPAARTQELARRRGDLAPGLLPAADRADLVRLQGRDRPARGRRQRHAAVATRRSGRSRRARSSSATPTRRASCRRCRPRTCSAATAPTSSSASCTRRSRPTGSTCARRPRTASRRRCSARRWSGAGRAARRWRSPPSATTPSSARDPRRNNDFLYGDDLRGFKCPAGAHARRANPRDALDGEGSVDVRLHRMIRRGTSYGPMLPEGVLEDDGADRGIIFVFAGAHLKRQFEFVKTQWLNDGIFIGARARRTRSSAPATARAASRSPSGRSGAGCRSFRRSWSRAAASTASPRACGRCAGWRSSSRDPRRGAGRG